MMRENLKEYDVKIQYINNYTSTINFTGDITDNSVILYISYFYSFA